MIIFLVGILLLIAFIFILIGLYGIIHSVAEFILSERREAEKRREVVEDFKEWCRNQNNDP